MAKDKLAGIVRRRYNKMKELTQEVFDKVEVNKALYRNVLNIDDTYEWDYSLTDPHVFPIMRNYLSRSNPSQTKIRLEARTPEDYEKRQDNQDLVNWELNEILLTSVFYQTYFSGFASGKGYLKTGWKINKAIEVQVKDEKGDLIRTKVMRGVLNRADAKFVRFNNILIPNRNIPNLEDQPYVAELTQMRIGDMLEENESGNYWDKKWLAELKKSGVEKQLLEYQMDMAVDDDTDTDFAFKSAYVSLICMHTLEGDVLYIPFKGDDKIVNKEQKNKYWHDHYPYIEFTPFPEDDEYYAMGIVDAVGDLQIAATEILNQTLTNVRQINTDMWIAGTPAAQTPDWEFQKRPNGIIRVAGDVSQIQQIRTQDNTQAAMRFSQELQNRIERASGISSLFASGAPGSNINQTARGAQIIDQNIDTNMRMILDLFGEQVIKRLGEHFLELNAQYITDEQTFFITGKRNARQVTNISPEHVSANFDVYVNSERMVKQTPASRQAQLQNLLVVVNQQAKAMGLEADTIPIFEALLDSYPEMENVDEVVVSIDEKAKRDISTMERGQEVEVKVRDSHLELMQIVKIHFEDNMQNYSDEIMAIFGKYFVDHSRYMQAKAEMQAMAQPQLPGPQAPGQLEASMGGNPEQAGLPENEQSYNLGPLVPPRSEV
jgi:hypothetical protein